MNVTPNSTLSSSTLLSRSSLAEPPSQVTHVQLPSGRRIPLQELVQKFLSELIRQSECEIQQEEAVLELERSWKDGIEKERTDERQKLRKETENLKNTVKVREYGLGGTLTIGGVASALSGQLLLGGAGIVGGVLQMLDQYFEQRGSKAVAAFFSSFLPVSEERCHDALSLFTTFASIASSYGFSNLQAISVATGMTKAAFNYVEGEATQRRDEHKARSLEIEQSSELVRDAILKIMEEIERSAETVKQFQTLKFGLEQKDHQLKTSIFSMIPLRR